MHIVANMKLIPQTQTMSCWYASAQMVINWRRETTQSCEMGMLDPSEDQKSTDLFNANAGINNNQIVGFAKRLGLETVPPLSPTPGAIEQWLRCYGPLWVNGKRHITVIAGIYGNDAVLVYDPAPVNTGKVEWRSLSTWYIGGSGSSRDTGNDVEIVFLHCPL